MPHLEHFPSVFMVAELNKPKYQATGCRFGLVSVAWFKVVNCILNPLLVQTGACQSTSLTCGCVEALADS